MQQRKTIGQRPQWPLPCFHFVFAVQIPNHSCVLVRTDYNKNCTIVIEIFLPKDDRGTIMDSHEIRVDLCRAVIHMEKKGVRVLKVRNIEDTNKASIDIWHMPEYQEAAESPVSDVVNACIESCFDSGAMFNLPCKANRKTHEVFAVECCASPDDDDSFSYAEVKINGKDYPINFIDDILLSGPTFPAILTTA